MKKIIFLLLISAPVILNAQSKMSPGIQFEHGLTWDQVKAKAVAENKYIFMDCYATWCGPCKYMNLNIFPLKEVGDYFNAHFISVAVQMDRTKTDTGDVKNWRPVTESIEREYSISSYPTYLFFAPDGQVLHRMIGADKEAKDFILKASYALKDDKQYYTVINRYKSHLGDSLFLRNALVTVLQSSDDINTESIGNAYVDCLKNPFTKDNLDLIAQITKSSKDQGFKLFLNNPSKIDSIQEQKDYAEGFVRSIIAEEEVYSVFKKDAPKADWDEISIRLKNKYPMYEDRIVATYLPRYYKMKKQLPEFEKAILYFLNKYGDQLSDYELNNNVWDVFLLSSNRNLLLEALKWSRRTIVTYPKIEPPNLDTYANLLYKTGNKKDAIIWEKKAIELAALYKITSNKNEFERTLIKMLKGEKTWPQ